MGKASLTHNPLSCPDSPLKALTVWFQDHIHMPDPTPLYVVLGATAANMMPGPPVWIMMVGPPACGKTEILNSLLKIPKVVSVGAITGVGALLSASSRRDIAAGATGGLLKDLGSRGMLVFKDFTSILSLPYEPLYELMAAFREIYDGRWNRAVGVDGGRVLKWSGRVAMAAACTPAIDRHHRVVGEMGERWITFRYRPGDGWGESMRALKTTNSDEARHAIQDAVASFFEAMGLIWDDVPRREMTDVEQSRVIGLATLAARCRSVVVRNGYTHEVEDVPQSESPARLSLSLGQLYLGLEAIGLDYDDRWPVVARVAMDCMPTTRRSAIEALVVGEKTTDQVKDHMRCSVSTVRRTLEDLYLHRVIERTKDGAVIRYRLSEWARTELSKAGAC